MCTVSFAVENYEAGKFWPPLAALVDMTGKQVFRTEWGDAFLDNLQVLGLDDFSDLDDVTLKYLGPITMHAGMPTYCLKDFFVKVADRRRKVPGLRAEQFVSWAAERAVSGTMYVDKPVEMFLRYGGNYAVDVCDRCFELLDVVGVGGTGDGVPLPSRYTVVAKELHDEARIQPPYDRATRHLSAVSTPRIVLDPYVRGVMVRLPSVDTGPSGRVSWQVVIGTQEEVVTVQGQWPGDPTPQTDVQVSLPIRSVSVSATEVDAAIQLQLVDEKQPLIAFKEDGELVTSHLPLPGTALWLLFPGDIDNLVVDGAIRLISQAVLPPGWAGWTLALADLGEAKHLRVGDALSGRPIRHVSAARVVTGEPVFGLITASGEPVFASLPTIELPKDSSTDTKWTVSLADQDGNLISSFNEFHHETDQESIWSGLSRPFAGKIRIRVRGPWGRGTMRDLVLAEALQANSQPMFRNFSSGGLAPAHVCITAPAQFSVKPAVFDLDEDQAQAPLSLSAETKSLPLILRIPYAQVSYQSLDQITPPSFRPLSLCTDDVVRSPGSILVRTEEAAPEMAVVVSSKAIQTLPPTGNKGLSRFDLAKVVDTLRAYPKAALVLFGAINGTVATLMPRKLFNHAKLGIGEIVFSDCANIDGLVAIVYQVRAPWRGGKSFPIEDGRAAISTDLCNAGPLRVLVRVDDPWLPAPIPIWSDTRVFLSAQGWLESEDDEETAFSRWLASGGPVPDRAKPAWAWATMAWLPSLCLHDHDWHEIVGGCRGFLLSDPVASLLALQCNGIPPQAIPRLLVNSKLALAQTWTDSEIPLHWSEANAIACTLLSAQHLKSADDDLGNLEGATTVCGDCVQELLGGTDPFGKLGRFDENSDAYAAKDESDRDIIKGLLGLIPKGILDGDSRVQAALALLESRADANRRLQEAAGELLAAMKVTCAATGEMRILMAIEARTHPKRPYGWFAYPALSVGFSLLARTAARGQSEVKAWVNSKILYWGYLAEAAPQLVGIDLIMAEFMVAGWEAGGEDS